MLVNKTLQYGFVATSGGNNLNPDDPPDPQPTPIPTPTPATLLRTAETTYLINDPNYAGVKSYYTAQNMIGLVTASQVKDGAGTVVSRSEMVYDESGRSPGYRGNPTTSRVWDSTKGAYTSSSAYISTSARFDSYGNQYEATDAKGNTATTTFDSTYQAFPISSTSPIPDPSGANGSNTAFVTTATFDTVTGLPLTTTDANAIETRIEYDPVTLRPQNTKTYYQGNQIGSTAETIEEETLGWGLRFCDFLKSGRILRGMARRLRIELEGGLYHVITRGNETAGRCFIPANLFKISEHLWPLGNHL